MKKLQSILFILVTVLYTIFMGYVLFHAAQVIPGAENVYANVAATKTILMMAFGFIITFFLANFILQQLPELAVRIIVILMFFVIAVGQVLYIVYLHPATNFDYMIVLRQAIEMQQTGTVNPDYYIHYFARYPFNYPVLFILYYLVKLSNIFKIEDMFLFPTIFSAVCMDVGVFFGYKALGRIVEKKKAAVFVLACAMNPVIYLWIAWGYSSVFSIPFLMGAVYFAIALLTEETTWKQMVDGLFLGFFVMMSTKVRITSFIVFIAFVIVVVIFKQFKKTWFAALPFFLATAIGVVMLFGFLTNTFVKFDGDQYEFPKTHWVMMGLSDTGQYNTEDRDFSANIPGKKEKTAANLEVIKERIKEKGPAGLYNLGKHKLLVTWQDGDCEYSPSWITAKKMSGAYKYLLGNKKDYAQLYAQAIYVAILLMAIIGMLVNCFWKKNPLLLLLQLTILGNTIFLLFWEAQSHYAISLLMIQIMIAMGSLSFIPELTKEDEKVMMRIGKGLLIAIFMFAFLGGSVRFALSMRNLNGPAYREYIARTEYSANESQTDIQNGEMLKQTFRSDIPFNHVYVRGYIADGADPNGKCIVKIYDESRNELSSTELSCADIAANQISVSFDSVMPKGEQRYTIQIMMKDMAEGNSLSLPETVSLLDVYPDGFFRRNEDVCDGDMIFQVYFQ